MRRLIEPLEGWQEERSRSTIRVLTLTHHMGEGEERSRSTIRERGRNGLKKGSG